MAVNLHATHYRFGINELAESTHGWHAAEDANPAQGAIAAGVTFLLRFTVQETGGTAAGNTDQRFQCALNGGAFQNITTTSTIAKAVTTTVFANGADLTKRLSGTGTFESSGDGGTHDGLSGGPQNDIAASGNSETECALQINDADTNAGDVITFRLTSPDFTITNDVVPTITLLASTPFSADLTTPSFGMAAQSVTRLNAYLAQLIASAFAMTPQSVTRLSEYMVELSSASFAFVGQAVNVGLLYTAELTAASFAFAAQAITRINAWTAALSMASIGFTTQVLTRLSACINTLTVASMNFTAKAISLGGIEQARQLVRWIAIRLGL